MKAQFATIEALLSLLISISAICIGANMVNGSQHSLNVEQYNLSLRAAAYDFLNQAALNVSTGQCLYLQSVASCKDNYSAYYKKIYGITRIGLVTNLSASNYSYIYCKTISKGAMCIGVS